MSRFFRNRLWTFILALALCFGSVAVCSNYAHADGTAAITDDPIGGGGVGNGFGDPDAPSGSVKRTILRGGVQVPSGSATIVGDGVDLQSAWMWRLRFALQALRGTWIHP